MARQSIKKIITKTISRVVIYRLIDELWDKIEEMMSNRKNKK